VGLREAADELGFPLVEVPYDVPFIAVTEKAASHLVNEHYALLQRAISAHERLERIALSDGGLDGLASALSELVSGSAVILDGRGETLARHGLLDDRGVATLAQEVRERARSGGRRDFAPGGELHGRSLALPVVRAEENGDMPQAWLVAAKDEGPLSELDRLILHQAVTIVGLELLRRRVADQTERRLAGDILSAMAAGQLEGPELARRLEPFGLRDRAAVLLLSPSRQLKASVDDALSRAVAVEAPAGLVATVGAYVCAVVGLPRGADPSDESTFTLAERLRARVSREAGVPLPAGAGRATSVGDVRRGFHEARCALESRTMMPSESSGPLLATYKDLGTFQLLLSLQDDDALRLFCDSILAPIEQSEGAYGGELMRSLEAFIECNGQWERAAKQLYCHRHTLRYRIRRVEELTGRSLDSARDRIDFWLALRGRELVR
jgi:purine catabolism regulator